MNGTAVVATCELSAASANVAIDIRTEEVVDFDTVLHHTHSGVTTGAGWHYHPPTTGYYYVDVKLAWANYLQFNKFYIRLRVNGVDDQYLDYNIAPAGTYNNMHGSTVVYLAAGEYVDVVAYHEDHYPQNLSAAADQNYINIFKIAESISTESPMPTSKSERVCPVIIQQFAVAYA